MAIDAFPQELKDVLANVTEAVNAARDATERSTAATGRVESTLRDVGSKVDSLSDDVARIKLHVFGSNPPPSPKNPRSNEGSFSLTEQTTEARRKATVASDGLAELEGKMLAGFSVLAKQNKDQLDWMGVGRKWFDFATTSAGRRKLVKFAGTVALCAGTAYGAVEVALSRAHATTVVVNPPPAPQASR